MEKELKRMLYKDARNRLITKILEMVENANSLGAIQNCEEVLKIHKVETEHLE